MTVSYNYPLQYSSKTEFTQAIWRPTREVFIPNHIALAKICAESVFLRLPMTNSTSVRFVCFVHPKSKLKGCSVCHERMYCSARCQRGRLATHKGRMRSIQKFPQNTLKIRRPSSSMICTREPPIESFCSPVATPNRISTQTVLVAKSRRRMKVFPSPEDLKRLNLKLIREKLCKRNAWWQKIMLSTPLACSIPSMLNHSCVP
jgi:hypothetical protein